MMNLLNKIDKTVELIEFYENNKLEVLLELDSFQDVLLMKRRSVVNYGNNESFIMIALIFIFEMMLIF